MLNSTKVDNYQTIPVVGDDGFPSKNADAGSSNSNGLLKKLLLFFLIGLLIFGSIYYYFDDSGNSNSIGIHNDIENDIDSDMDILLHNNDIDDRFDDDLVSLVDIGEDTWSYSSMSCIDDGALNSNNYDKPLTWHKGNGYYLSGMLSKHNNYYEDRLFSMDYCRINGINYYKGGTSSTSESQATFSYTSFDAGWMRGCGGRSGLTKIESIHSNNAEDRKFKFTCNSLPDNYIIKQHSCGWYISDLYRYDEPVDFQCPGNGIVRTILSPHNNYYQDRLFKFECCRVITNYPNYQYIDMNSFANPHYSNQWDGVHNNFIHGWFMSGLYSIHDNYREDRLFKWRYSKPLVSGSGYTFTQVLSKTTFDSKWRASCDTINNGHAALISGYSYHSNHYEDREWTFTCGALNTNQYKLANCGWTGYLNDWDKPIDFKCLNRGVIRSIWSEHSNYYEDRLYRFECCEFIHA